MLVLDLVEMEFLMLQVMEALGEEDGMEGQEVIQMDREMMTVVAEAVLVMYTLLQLLLNILRDVY